MLSFKQFENSLLKKGFEAEFNQVNVHLVTIEIIGVPKQLHGKGYGSKIMNQLCTMADANGVMLQLRPAASSTHSRSKLVNFYSKFDFVENKGQNKNQECTYDYGMYRLPKSKLVEKILKEGFLLEKKSTYSYGCVMLDTTNGPIKKLQTQIEKDDIYEEKGNDKFGLEKESHITLLYGIEKEVTLQQVKDILNSFDFPKEIEVNKISLFDTDDRYDVLKCDVSMPILNKINKKLRTLPYKNEYPDYKAHITIAYLKKGQGKKYVNMFKSESFKLSTENCLFSHGETKDKIKVKKELNEENLHEINLGENFPYSVFDKYDT